MISNAEKAKKTLEFEETEETKKQTNLYGLAWICLISY
jgi:hypothetical protein